VRMGCVPLDWVSLGAEGSMGWPGKGSVSVRC
jgi:hypothetical protein